ncbi:hypothetical protein [Streptomyces sp. GbtcB6]|uniref:hypothetical protein n=1 Tax=Streptomyces sp. GbtcB6 TaxID=2824751 RepID=UPI001C2FBA87|nr:hypothetical protein [Streptomyces sp. GbtcB6]
MQIAMALMALMLVLGSVSAVRHARKGRWGKAVEVLLPVLGANLMLLGGVERHITVLFWLGILLVVTGLGVEALSFWRARGAESEPSGR